MPRTANGDLHNWNGALVSPLEGEAYSAFGVSREHGGIRLVRVPADSRAARAGLQTNDIIEKIDGRPIRNLDQLKSAPQPMAEQSIRINYVREQQAAHLEMPVTR